MNVMIRNLSQNLFDEAESILSEIESTLHDEFEQLEIDTNRLKKVFVEFVVKYRIFIRKKLLTTSRLWEFHRPDTILLRDLAGNEVHTTLKSLCVQSGVEPKSMIARFRKLEKEFGLNKENILGSWEYSISKWNTRMLCDDRHPSEIASKFYILRLVEEVNSNGKCRHRHLIKVGRTGNIDYRLDTMKSRHSDEGFKVVSYDPQFVLEDNNNPKVACYRFEMHIKKFLNRLKIYRPHRKSTVKEREESRYFDGEDETYSEHSVNQLFPKLLDQQFMMTVLELFRESEQNIGCDAKNYSQTAFETIVQKTHQILV